MPSAIECPVCFEVFRQPVQLSCGHTLDLECLENIVRVDQQRDAIPEELNQRNLDDNLAALVQNFGMRIQDVQLPRGAQAVHGGGAFLRQANSYFTLPTQMVDTPPIRRVTCPECRRVTEIPEGGPTINYRVQSLVEFASDMQRRLDEAEEKLQAETNEEARKKLACKCCNGVCHGNSFFICRDCRDAEPLCALCSIRFHRSHDCVEKIPLTEEQFEALLIRIANSAESSKNTEQIIKMLLSQSNDDSDLITQVDEVLKIFNDVQNAMRAKCRTASFDIAFRYVSSAIELAHIIDDLSSQIGEVNGLFVNGLSPVCHKFRQAVEDWSQRVLPDIRTEIERRRTTEETTLEPSVVMSLHGRVPGMSEPTESSMDDIPGTVSPTMEETEDSQEANSTLRSVIDILEDEPPTRRVRTSIETNSDVANAWPATPYQRNTENLRRQRRAQRENMQAIARLHSITPNQIQSTVNFIGDFSSHMSDPSTTANSSRLYSDSASLMNMLHIPRSTDDSQGGIIEQEHDYSQRFRNRSNASTVADAERTLSAVERARRLLRRDEDNIPRSRPLNPAQQPCTSSSLSNSFSLPR